MATNRTRVRAIRVIKDNSLTDSPRERGNITSYLIQDNANNPCLQDVFLKMNVVLTKLKSINSEINAQIYRTLLRKEYNREKLFIIFIRTKKYFCSKISAKEATRDISSVKFLIMMILNSD